MIWPRSSSTRCCRQLEQEGFAFHDRDVVGMTEAIVACSQGNYATVDQIAACVRELFPQGTVGLVFPILSRNRFAMLLKGIARGVDKLVVQLSYPADEVGNEIVDRDRVDAEGLNPLRCADRGGLPQAFRPGSHPSLHRRGLCFTTRAWG